MQIVEALHNAALGQAAGRLPRRAAGGHRSGGAGSHGIGRLMQTVPELTEIDVNPLMVHARGQGATALDALIVVE